MKTVFILVFVVHAYYGPAVSVSPFPYATIEACEAAAKAFREKSGAVNQYGNCLPSEAPEPTQ